MLDLEDRAGVVTHSAHEGRVETQTTLVASFNSGEKVGQLGRNTGVGGDFCEPGGCLRANLGTKALGKFTSHSLSGNFVELVDDDHGGWAVSLGNAKRRKVFGE